jgi:hypothetical protein
VFFVPLFFWLLESVARRKPAGAAIPAGAHAKREGD